jgi:hypothetical protein
MGVATFSEKPQFPVQVEYVRRHVSTEGRDGFSRARQTNQTVSQYSDERRVRRWTLAFEHSPDSQWTAILGYYDSSVGGTLPLSWTPPDEASPIDVILLDPEPQNVKSSAANGRSYLIRLQEVI